MRAVEVSHSSGDADYQNALHAWARRPAQTSVTDVIDISREA
jgi:hypothetical protein